MPPSPAPARLACAAPASTLRHHLDQETDLFHPAGNTPAGGVRTINGTEFVLAPTTDALRDLSHHEQHDRNISDPTYVISSLLKLDVDTTTLSTSLVGHEEYATALSEAQVDRDSIHISTQLPAEYRHEWDDLTVVGGGAEAGYADTPLVALDCRADGRMLSKKCT